MTKKIANFKNYSEEVIKAFDESRVLLISQGEKGLPNVMAIGWGTMGIVWRRPIFAVLVRPSRYTHRLIEESGKFTVNIVPASMKEIVQYCGKVSGRDHDKFKEKQITPIPSTKVKTPILQEGILHFECQVVQKSDLLPSETTSAILSDFYPKGDFHRIYFGEILACQSEI
jgi:flavin reductase (DIM6/NTAB) family NADH-FMN oxidoreductase RutF